MSEQFEKTAISSPQKRGKKQFYLILAALILLVSSSGIFLWKTYLFPKETLYVAVVGPMSTPNGEAIVQGVQLALNQP